MITVIYVIPMVDIVVWDDICYAFTVVLDLLWFVILWRYSMMHVMVWFIHNALFILVMRWLTPPSVDRWERCGHAHEIWIIALVFRILSIMKYDVCRYRMADVTRHMYWVTCEIQPNILYLGVKKEKYDVGVRATTLALRGWPSNTNEYFFQLCVLGHIAVIKSYH